MPGFEARIVPENITMLPKSATQTTGGNAWNERLVAVKKNETVGLDPARLGARRTTSAGSRRARRRADATAA